MALSAPAAREQRRFRWAAAGLVGATVVFTVLLLPIWPQAFRESVTGIGLLLAGLIGLVSGVRRARLSTGAASRPWWILTTAAAVAITGNLWVAATGSDPTTSPSTVSIVSIAVALSLSVIALLSFPMPRRRGAELLVMLLDGVVAGGAFLLITSVLAFTELLESSTATTTADRVTGIAFPALDVLLATVAVLLVVRASPTDRQMLVLVACGFLLYATSDLAYAVRMARGTFEFGTLFDLGWIVGYLLLALAAWTPMRRVLGAEDRLQTSVADALGTILVFSVLVAATVVQVLFGAQGSLHGVQAALWVLIVVAAGIRQALLTIDNNALRRGLERRVEEQTADLRRLARQNEVLITSVGDGVYGVDHQGRVTFLNPSGAAALGYTPEELEGRLAHDAFHAPDPDGVPYPSDRCYIHEAITAGLVANAEEDEYVRADGTTFPVEITASPLLDEAEVRGAVVVFRDVTQRREVDRMKDEFLSVVSHELRTPLTSIRGSLGLLAGGRMGDIPERAASLINVAVQSTERLTRLINDLLDIERMESGTRPMEMAALDARYLLESAAHQIEGMATSMGVGVEVLDAPGRVLADEDRIIQTLLNLAGNAIKFSDPGSTIRLDAAEEGDEVHFRVADDGRGVPADKLDSIFERFQQVDSSDTRQKGGTGLGLAISKGIVERHGGRIWAESELGVGTTIHFTLPAAIRLNVSGDAGPDAALAPTVLVCDDDPVVVEEFATLLRGHGYRPIPVTDGAQAVSLARAQRPSAVVLDLRMPGTTGAQVMAALRSTPVTHDIPVVVMSGLGPESDQYLARTADDWLIKPVSEERLVQAVSMAVVGRPESETVLLVEDDEALAEVVATLLADEGLSVVRATSATEAIQRGQELHPGVIVLDLRLPDGNGSDVVAAFRERGSLAHTPLVVYSVVDVDDERRHDLHLGTTVFLTKERTTPEQLRDEVIALVEAVTGHRRTARGGHDGTDTG
jgi:PAS domain S-box-containing protein